MMFFICICRQDFNILYMYKYIYIIQYYIYIIQYYICIYHIFIYIHTHFGTTPSACQYYWHRLFIIMCISINWTTWCTDNCNAVVQGRPSQSLLQSVCLIFRPIGLDLCDLFCSLTIKIISAPDRHWVVHGSLDGLEVWTRGQYRAVT